jgi:hypothetical protein
MPTESADSTRSDPAPSDPESLGGQLVALRLALGLSQTQVAQFLSRPGEPPPVQRLQHWERNRRRPRTRRELLTVAAELHKLHPGVITLSQVERLVRAYQPRLPLTAAERAEFFPDTLSAHIAASAAGSPVSAAAFGPLAAPAAPPDNHAGYSPFIAGPPITDPRYFFGRTRELTRLFNLLRRRPLQNAAIIGDRHSGKTSLLQYLTRITRTPADQLRAGQRTDWLDQPERYRWIYVDFRDPQLGSRQGLLGHLLSQLGAEVPAVCTMARFSELARRHLGTPTVILLDDIEVALQHYPELDYLFWEGLRALALNQVDGNLGFVLTAREPFAQLTLHEVAGSPFFTIFGYTTLLDALTEAEARELIASSPIPFPPADVEWIVTHSTRRPIRLQILCRERLLALELGETGSHWQAEGLRQMALF